MARKTMPPWFVDSPDPESTHVLAALLGRSIGARGLAIGLVGPLGSGKTAFVKGLAEGLGLDPDRVSSPTFVLAQQYALPEGPERLHHLDFYRLASEAELEAIGFLDLLGDGQVLAVEWLDRFPDALGPDRLEIVFLAAMEHDESAGGAVDGAEADEADEADEAIEATDAGEARSKRRIRVTAFGDEASRVLQDWTARWERWIRARGAGAGDRPGADFDWRSLLALLFAGGLGLDLVVGAGAFDSGGRATGQPGARMACAALAPEAGAVGPGAGAAGHGAGGHGPGEPGAGDGLGPLRVRCLVGDEPVATASLGGMARLLDGGRIDPNVASRRLLETLPGIGPGRAAAIEAERARDRFRSTRELERVSGIGPKTRARLETFLSVDSEGTAG